MNVSGFTSSPTQRLRNKLVNQLDDVWFGHSPKAEFTVKDGDVVTVEKFEPEAGVLVLVATRPTTASVQNYDSRFVLVDTLFKLLEHTAV